VSQTRLLVLDIEGVLTPPGGSQHPWPLGELLELRRQLRDSPLAVALCTGRQEPYGEAMVQALDLFRPLPDDVRARVRECCGRDLHSWPSIFENGAYFYDPIGKQAFPHPGLDSERIALLRRLRTETLEPLAVETGAEVEPGKEYSVSLNPPFRSPGSPERMTTDEFRPRVEEALREFVEAIEIKHSASAIDVTPAGVSKASAVRLLLDWTGLARDEVLGVGDSTADEAWLREVGWTAAPSNGRDHLPGLGYYASQPVTEGVLEIVHRLRSNGWRSI
jgi:hydroxymethylpyrimidine pyrophosphatase-like HAD family hydrolase